MGNDDAQRPAAGVQYGISRLLTETFNLRDDSMGHILQELLEAARLHLGMEVAFISEVDSRRRTFRYVDKPDGIDVCQVGSSDPLDESYCQKVIEGRLPELIEDARELPETRDLRLTQDLGIGAYVSSPIRLNDGTVYGTFCTFSFRADHTLNERDLALMRVFSTIAGDLIQKNVDQSRHETEKRNRIAELLETGEFATVWQPIVDLASQRVIGVESLARFPGDPGRGPAAWFEDAGEVGLGESLEASAIEKGLEVVRHLPGTAYVAMNVSAHAFLKSRIAGILNRMPLERLVLEITEHDTIEDYAALANALGPLRRRGLRLAVDDAGAGYASFQHILRLRPDVIKLDMSLTRDIDAEVAKRSLAASLVQFSREIDAKLIAEGVETMAELETLARLGVHGAQGFCLHEPLTVEGIVAIFDATD